jgi:multidrug resistance efflux pump
LQAAELDLAHTIIRSPVHGIVARRKAIKVRNAPITVQNVVTYDAVVAVAKIC